MVASSQLLRPALLCGSLRMSIVTRFAPSPTGYLHLGHAHAALIAWRRARQAGGRFLLRIEDIDPGRCRPEFTAAIQEDLAWLGLGLGRRGAGAVASICPNIAPCWTRWRRAGCSIRASARAPTSRARWRSRPPRRTRRTAAPLYPGTCRALPEAERAARIAAGEPYALRLDMARALGGRGTRLTFDEAGEGWLPCDPARFGDVVLARKDAPASYHLCVTHDDAVQGVTLVTRGEDLKPATDLHRLFQALMGWPAPAYAHHRSADRCRRQAPGQARRRGDVAGAARRRALARGGARHGSVSGLICRWSVVSVAGQPTDAPGGLRSRVIDANAPNHDPTAAKHT